MPIDAGHQQLSCGSVRRSGNMDCMDKTERWALSEGTVVAHMHYGLGVRVATGETGQRDRKHRCGDESVSPLSPCPRMCVDLRSS